MLMGGGGGSPWKELEPEKGEEITGGVDVGRLDGKKKKLLVHSEKLIK